MANAYSGGWLRDEDGALVVSLAGGGTGAHVSEYGATADGVLLKDNVVTTAGSNIVTCASASFTQADVGKIVAIRVAGSLSGSLNNGLAATITQVDSATQIRISANATTAFTTTDMVYGTDQATALTAALTAAAASQVIGVLHMDAGYYMVGSRLTVPGGVTLQGEGIDYMGPSEFPERGTVILAGGETFRTATGSNSVLVKLGAVTGVPPITNPGFASGNTHARIKDLILNGNDSILDVLDINGTRWEVDGCQIEAGQSNAVSDTNGQNGYMRHSIIRQKGRGVGIRNNGADNKYIGNQIRGYTTAGIYGSGANTEVTGNHIFNESTADPTPAGPGLLIAYQGYLVTGNVFGTPALAGPDITVVADSGGNVRDINITGNHFYRQSPAAKAAIGVKLDTTLGPLNNLLVSSNTLDGGLRQANKGFKSIVDVIGAGAITCWQVSNNNGQDVFAVVTAASGQAPDFTGGNVYRADSGAGMVTTVG